MVFDLPFPLLGSPMLRLSQFLAALLAMFTSFQASKAVEYVNCETDTAWITANGPCPCGTTNADDGNKRGDESERMCFYFDKMSGSNNLFYLSTEVDTFTLVGLQGCMLSLPLLSTSLPSFNVSLSLLRPQRISTRQPFGQTQQRSDLKLEGS